MKINNLTSPKTNKPVANQVSVEHKGELWFSSYGTTIARYVRKTGKLYLDEYYFNYSVTTSKYLNCFLSENSLNKDNAIYKNLQEL